MFKSLKDNGKGILLMLVSSLCVCTGQLFWKLSAENIIFLFVGFILYGIGALVMLMAYKFGSLSVLQPMLSLNYVFTVILASVVLHEEITTTTLIGMIIVFIGTILIGGGDN
ncbi:MAG: EamA family transporter [Ruminococcus sp.]|nr:EamA family transporter [Ruminococcus sp.]